jgi:nucleoside-diphosphate-sugar epimerase
MRVLVVGGTRFIGRALVEELLAHDHEVMVLHRGRHEPDGLPDVPHLHADRRDLAPHRAALAGFNADAAADIWANSGAETEAFLRALPGDPHLVMTSSADVYRAFASLHAGVDTDPLPLDEDAPLRTEPVAGLVGADPDELGFDPAAYDNRAAERAYLARGGTVLRLPMVYGEHDYQRREEPVLARVRAGRRRIPVGPGTFLWTKGWVRDLAAGIRLALASDRAAGEVFNLGEARSASIGLWLRWILEAAGADAELVRVPGQAVPDDLMLTRSLSQHLLVDTSKARAVLGYRDTDPREAVHRSVRWHLEHPPAPGASPELFDADDRALAAAQPA